MKQASDSGMDDSGKHLRTGWTTGACAAATSKAACMALLSGQFPDPVEITLPAGRKAAFSLAEWSAGEGWACAGIVKDAGDDPDVTHGALIRSTIRRSKPGTGILFKAGKGVGTVTLAGLPLPPDEPAINPVPRQMIREVLQQVSPECQDYEVEISVDDGERIAQKTMNPRLGILGGLSILGTTGIVIPYSCAAWIHSIQRGIDVARAAGLKHIAGTTGHTSEEAVKTRHNLPDLAMIDMADFVGGMLKYVRAHPVEKVTIGGGMAKITKLAQGRMDLHSKRGLADFEALSAFVAEAGGSAQLVSYVRTANTVAEIFDLADQEKIDLGFLTARKAWQVAASVIDDPSILLEILVFDRKGKLLGEAPFAPCG